MFNGLGTHRTRLDRDGIRQSSIESIMESVPLEESYGNLYQVPLPEDGRFTGLPYGSLFTFLIHRHRVISLGLYRRTIQTTKGHVQMVKYVVINPHPQLKLASDDALFMLGARPVVWG